MTGRSFAPDGFDFTFSALCFHFQDLPATFLLVLSVDDLLMQVVFVQELKLAASKSNLKVRLPRISGQRKRDIFGLV